VSEVKKVADPERPGQPDVRALIRRAEGGDESAVPALRQVLTGPGGLVETAGNMALQVQATLIRKAAGTNLFFKEGLEVKMDRLRTDLAGKEPSPLERLLADRIALCWLSLHDAEARFTQAEGLNWKQTEYWQRWIDAAHRRYLSAVRTLATVRKLALPSLQVNIARKQVNVLAGATDAIGRQP
jgi:hypothetical protein